ncbi:Myosin 10A, isoform D [Phlyctochytrium bullatum]|nr:Myosin 10A, isoform D [Phlyctochytrium bullatum]
MDPSNAFAAAAGTSPPDRPFRLVTIPSSSSIGTNGTSRTAPGAGPAMHYVKALYDFVPKEPEELPMEEEDIISLPSMVAKGGWLFGENNGAWGWFPESYVRVLTEEEIYTEGLIPFPTNTSGYSSNPSSLYSANTLSVSSGQTSVPGSVSPNPSASSNADPAELSLSGLVSPPSEGADVNQSIQAANKNAQQQVSAASGWFSKYKPRNKRSGSSPLQLQDSDADEASTSNENLSEPPKPAISVAPLAKHGSSKSSSGGPGKAGTKRITADMLRVNKGNVAIVGAPAESRKTWTDFVGGPEAVEKLQISKQERKRQDVIFEILSTERDYVEDLNIIIEVYIKQLRKTKVIRPKDMSVVFSNIEAMIPVNRELLKSLEARQAQSTNGVVEQIGDIFIGVSDYLKMYTMYCSNHPYALMKLQSLRNSKAVAKFLDQCAATPECKNMALSHFLLKPVQRICKYPLLLRELIRSTDEGHPDAENLQKALMKIETVVTIVNEGARQAEAVHKMIELQNRFTQRVNIVAPSRIMKRAGTVDILTPQNERKKRELFLFNDMLLVAKSIGGSSNPIDASSATSTDGKLKLVAMVPFDMILINSLPEDMGNHPPNLIEIVHINAAKFTLAAESSEAKEAWVTAFKEATDTWMSLKKRGAGVEVQERVLRTAAMSDVSSRQVQAPTASLPALPKKPDGAKEKKQHVEIKEESADRPQDAEEPAAKPTQISSLAETKQASTNSISLDNLNTAKKPPAKAPKPSLKTSSATDVRAISSPQASPDSPLVDSAVSIFGSKSAIASEPAEQPSTTTSNPNLSATSRVSSRLATNYFIVQDLHSLRPPTSSTGSLTASHARAATFDPTASSPLHASAGTISLSPSSSVSIRLNLQAGADTTAPSPTSISPSPSFTRPLATASRPVAAGPSLDRRINIPSSFLAGGAPPRNAGYLGVPGSRLRTKSISDKTEESPVARVNTGRVSATSMEFTKVDTVAREPEIATKKPTINRPVKSATIVDVVRKTEKNGKDFVYTTRVQYVGQTEPNVVYIIQHTYEDFFDFHLQLIGHFPEEAGVGTGAGGGKGGVFKQGSAGSTSDDGEAGGKAKRIIPELPGQMMVVSEAVAKTRLEMLQTYVESVLSARMV